MKRPKILEDAGFDMYVDTSLLRGLPLPIQKVPLSELEWCFDLPLWEKDGTDDWNLTPREVIERKDGSSEHAQRVNDADLAFPIIVVRHKGKFVPLDGVHRIVKAHLAGMKTMSAKIYTPSKRLFITGIPTSGKSYLAKKIAAQVGGIAVNLDDLRESLISDPRYAKWVNFYLDRDEKAYLTQTSADDQWKNLVAQSEAMWPAFLEKIKSYADEPRPVIFECVNILPHIAKQHLDFPGIVLIGSSYDETLARNMKDPRWGATKELQELEAKTFFTVERPRYKAEADKYGYPVFDDAEQAFETAVKLIS